MSTDTVALPHREVIRREREAIRARARAFLELSGWSQNKLARAVRKEHSLFSKWMRGVLESSIIAGRVAKVVDREEPKILRARERGAA
jgi:hypothetical protein